MHLRPRPDVPTALGRLLPAVLLVLVAGACGRVGGEPFQPTHTVAVPLVAGQEVGQTLNPVGPIAGVDLLVATYGRVPDAAESLTVSVEALDGTGGRAGTVLAEAVVAGEALADNTWVAARLEEPVAGDGPVAITATWSGDQPIALRANRTLEGTEGIANDPYPDGQLLLDGRPATGDLAFRVTTTPSAGAAASQLTEVARSAAGRALDDPLFAVGWGLALLGSLALAVTGLGRRR